MKVVETATGKSLEIEIRSVSKKDIAQLTKAKYSFNWKKLATEFPLIKLTIEEEEEEEILGVMALVEHNDEKRLEIRLVASSRENVGRGKKYDGIFSCLLAYSCSLALENYGELACVSLLPKTTLKEHYVDKYRMRQGGKHVYLDGKPLFQLARNFMM